MKILGGGEVWEICKVNYHLLSSHTMQYVELEKQDIGLTINTTEILTLFDYFFWINRNTISNPLLDASLLT